MDGFKLEVGFGCPGKDPAGSRLAVLTLLYPVDMLVRGGMNRDDMTTATTDQFRILIADDSPEELELITCILSRAGYRLIVAQDGHQALTRAVANLPDLVLMDLYMPRTNGLAVLRRLKADPLTAKIPVIVLSSSIDPPTKVQALRAGAVDYVTKPYDASEILARVQIHLSLARKIPPSAATGSSTPNEVLVRAAMPILMERLSEPPLLQELANMLGCPARSLGAAFHAMHGLSYFEFVKATQMDHAKHLLQTTSLHIGEIALEVGYSSDANFFTAFRNHFGTTPSSLRNRRSGS